MTLDEILKEIKNANTIVILTHESPDGDAIGSSLSAKYLAEKFGKEADVIIPKYSRMYNYLPKIDTIKEESEIKKYDLAISVDCADLKRIAKYEYFENAKTKIVIDHHGSNNMYGDINFVNPVAPSCCEILAGMFQYYEMDITKSVGECLLTGIITDTGGFRHSSITPETFEFTAELIRKGVNLSEIYKRTMCTKTKANFELTKRVMDRMEILENGRVAFTYIDSKDEKEVFAEEGDHEGLVDIGREIEGVEISVFLRQRGEENTYKISMRSGSKINVSDICMIFGGGGHPKAAGALIQGPLDEAKYKIMKEIKKALK